MSYKLIHGDCLEVMPTLESGSVDAIICDLPYGTTNCHWDSVIPFEPLWTQYKRLIKPRGAIVLFGSQPFTSALIMSNIEWFRDEWIWQKDRATRHLDCKIRPMKSHENIIVFGSELPFYNPQKTQNAKPAAKSGKENGNLGMLLRGGILPSESYGQTDRYPITSLNFNVPNHGEMGYHPTQKPVDLLRYLIRTYTNEGEIILDNTMGSGSTIVAAIQEGRNAIGIERDADYFAIAQQRCLEATYQPSLFTPQPTQWQPVAMFGDD